MTIEIFMPALSPTMESGNLVSWLVKEGDPVESGTMLAEIETDKATMEYESIDDGIMGKIIVAEGAENVAVGELIAILLEEGEDASALENISPRKIDAPVEVKAEVVPVVVVATESVVVTGDRFFSSPLARRIAAQKSYDIADIKGSGPHGRVIKRDVESYKPLAKTAQAAPSLDGDAPYTEIKLSNMRKTIAKRLTESKQTVPHFYLGIDIELDNLMAARKELNSMSNSMSDDYKISVNDFIIRACALALKKVPAANVQFGGDVMRHYDRSDVSVAVAIEGGLVTPVIRGAEQKGLRQISEETKALAKKARDGKLMPEEYTGGTFSISNLGMMGIKQFQAVINPPQASILAVGGGEQRVVVKDGVMTPVMVMSVNLACDHRAIDGAVGAEFLGAIKTFLEHPSTMLL
ncbi:Dihydrolipoamide acetyltransferase component of pyruvate dehydrogenase complex [hydrothermal vent metagenome]|uniref:dihydrolipoyllysine-residue acetyltransferase n=1 Tax=hydrothermal vent metagenome TaxID=652676 RepID=A0A3B1AJS9_9ZZZZ